MLGLQEQRYRRHFLGADRRIALLFTIAATLGAGAYVRNDLLLFGDSPLLPWLVAARAATLVTNTAAMVVMWRARRPRAVEHAVGISIVTLALLCVIASWTRANVGELVGPVLADALLLTGTYFVLRGAVFWRLLAAALLSLAALLPVWSPVAQASAVTRTSLVIAVVFLNVVGLAFSRFFEKERKQRFAAERNVLVTNRRLDAKVSELAAEKEHALALSRARASFLAAMSHEFRTPMNAVIGLSDLLLDAPLGKEEREHARAIRESARALLSLLNDILDFAKIDAEKLTLAPVAFDARELAASVVEMMRQGAEQKSLGLFLAIAPEVPRRLVSGDEMRLRQVLVNLLSNAVKFTEKGKVRLDLGARPANGGDVELLFSVADTGIGIEEEAQSRLFQPFEQADRGIERRFGGTGLGLAICKRIVHAMGGALSVKSAPGQGSVFSFSVTLPYARGARVPSGTWRRGPRAAPLSVLVVDDHPINRQVAVASLKRLGHTADVVSDGPEAIRAAAEKRYDVIFMDLQMPKMDGIETTRRILAPFQGADAPIGPSSAVPGLVTPGAPPRIVAMTASVRETDRALCFEAGMSGFLGKPIDLRELSDVLARADGERTSVPTPSDPLPEGPRSASPLDPDKLASLRALESATEPGLVASLCDEFAAETRERMDRMDRARAAGDLPALEREAHGLKAASATMGAMDLSAIAAQIEAVAREGSDGEAGRSVDRLFAEWTRVERALRDLREAEGTATKRDTGT